MSEIASLVCRLVFQMDSFTSGVFFITNTVSMFCLPFFFFTSPFSQPFSSLYFSMTLQNVVLSIYGWTSD